MKLKDWIRDARGQKPSEETYVDASALPAEPEGPYRARMAESTHTALPAGIDVSEREVVTGQLLVVYRTHCPCGHEWESAEPQRLSLCPRCNRAVLVELP